MAALALLFAAIWQGETRVAPEPRFFRWQRNFVASVTHPAAGPSCALLPGELYAHSHKLADVRLYRNAQEVPYALSTSQTAPLGDPARVLNAGLRDGRVVFDLAMPARPYTDVQLALAGHDFVANATVTGRRSPADEGGTALGSFTLFDLSGSGLGHATTLHLVESTFPFLHVELSLSGAGGKGYSAAASLIAGAEVPPSRQAQVLYTVVAQTGTITQVGRHSVARFHLPARVPVERVTFTLQPGDHTNFSRAVTVLAHADTTNPQDPEARESVAGEITRIDLTQGTHPLREESLSVPIAIGANVDHDADLEVWIENGDDKPLALASVQLEMRQRLLCFDADPAALPTLSYGDAGLDPPVYDYSRTFDPTVAPVDYALSAEEANPRYAARATKDTRSFVDRHPRMIWVVLLGVMAALGLVAYRSATRLQTPLPPV